MLLSSMFKIWASMRLILKTKRKFYLAFHFHFHASYGKEEKV
jgi:hypothetical protein